MIKLEKVNKYFNRHKKNQIHVIDNTSLELPDTGLVALLGASGSGKTTLLNAIGGLDKVNSGNIIINGKKITRKSVRSVDKIRALNIGYIFQNYYLLDHLTVEENVKLELKIIGIKDKNEIDKRVEYVLKSVGMYKYRNRYANMLSGGERGRVGIARALVSNPSVIIADEPTGNLDSKNTLQIMNIIKSISKDRLVILVTHEKNLAEFYATRIIEIEDGKTISDRENIHDNKLDYRLDNKIYLKDLEYQDNIKTNNSSINYYSDKKDKLKLTIAFVNDNIYIESVDNKNIILVNEESAVELVNDKYKEISKNNKSEFNYDLNSIIDKNIKPKYKSIFNIFSLIKEGIKRVIDYSFIKKLLLLGFFGASMFITFAVSTTFASLDIKDEEFIKYNKNYLVLKDGEMSIDKYREYSSAEGVSYILPGDSLVELLINLDKYTQTYNSVVNISGSISSSDIISEEDIISGRMIENDNEIVLDKMVFDNEMLSIAKQAGFLSIEDFIGKSVKVGNYLNYVIVGITDKKSPSIYAKTSELERIVYNSYKDIDEFYMMDEDLSYLNSSNKIKDYKLLGNEITLKEGSYPVNDYEVIINIKDKDLYKINSNIDVKVNNIPLKVVGYYESTYTIYDNLVSENTIKYDMINKNNQFMVYGKDKEDILNKLKSKNVFVEDAYKNNRDNYISEVRDSIISRIVFSGIILVISLVEIYLIMRSSFLSRIKEVGIMRAIGVKVSDIYKMFSGEIISISVIASVPGLLFMSYVLYNLSKIVYIENYIMINFLVIIVSLIIVLVFNLLFGLLPVFSVVRQRPARILSRNDVE